MSNKYVMLDLNDPRISNLADVISNKTSKKILDKLSDKEMSANELAESLGMPLNTITYNLEKLTESGLIERTGKFLWSSKGKKVPLYKVSNKKIIISPKLSIRGVIPAVLISGLAAIGVKLYTSNYEAIESIAPSATDAYSTSYMEGAKLAASSDYSGAAYGVTNVASSVSHDWAWFLMGALLALFVFLTWNWRTYFSRN